MQKAPPSHSRRQVEVLLHSRSQLAPSSQVNVALLPLFAKRWQTEPGSQDAVHVMALLHSKSHEQSVGQTPHPPPGQPRAQQSPAPQLPQLPPHPAVSYPRQAGPKQRSFSDVPDPSLQGVPG